MDWKLELVAIPVSDVDRAKAFHADIGAARDRLAGRGVEVSEIQEFPWGSFVFFSDPDGNRWSVQHIPARAREPARRHGGGCQPSGTTRPGGGGEILQTLDTV